MNIAIPMVLVGLISAALIVIGCIYIIAPGRILGGFGLKAPASDPDTYAWLHLKGIRDVATGAAVLTLMLATNTRTVGILTLVLALIPFGDMFNILVSGGKKATALSVHGITCVVMVVAGLWLLPVF